MNSIEAQPAFLMSTMKVTDVLFLITQVCDQGVCFFCFSDHNHAIITIFWYPSAIGPNCALRTPDTISSHISENDDFNKVTINLRGAWTLQCHCFRLICLVNRGPAVLANNVDAISIPNSDLKKKKKKKERPICRGEDDYHSVSFKSRGNKWGLSYKKL